MGSTVNIGTPSNNTVTTAILQNGSVTNDKVSASAAIAKSKLANLDIVNADINASAAIAGTKVSPDFGSQTITTTGSLSCAAVVASGGANITGNADFGAGIDVTGEATFNQTTNTIRTNSDSAMIELCGGSTNNIGNGAKLTLHGDSHSSTGFVDLSCTSGSHLQFRTGTSKRLQITSDGKIGIGTDTPDQTLHVHKGSAGSVASVGNSVLTLENNNDVILQFLSPNNVAQQIRFGDPQDNGAGYIDYNHGNNVMSFGAAGPEKLRIQSGGGISFNGDSAAANALDDYEEGYWTPTATDGMALTNDAGTNNYASRRYVKIGRHVTAWFDVTFSSSNSSANFRTRFGGLPYSPQSNYAGAAAVCIGFFTGDNDHGEGLVGHIDQTTGLIKFYRDGDEMYSYSNSAGDRIAGFVSYFTT